MTVVPRGAEAAERELPAAIVADVARLDSLLARGAAGEAVRFAAGRAGYADDLVYGWQWHQRWGIALLRDGQTAAAVPHLEAAVRGAPDVADNHRNLATALQLLGRGGRAVGEYQQAVELAPDDPTLRLEYGQALRGLGMERAALAELQAADLLGGDSDTAARALAELHVAAGRWQEARPYLERVLASDPDDIWARKALALQQLRGGAADSAVALLEPVPAVQRDGEIWLLLAEADRDRGRCERWMPLLDEDPPGNSLPAKVRGSALFWAVLADALERCGRSPEALAAVDCALARAPADTVFLSRRIVLLQALGREGEARAEYERLRRIRSGNGPRR